MDIEPTGGREPPGRQKRMVLSINEPADCPCGEEPREGCRDGHALGRNCQKLVVAHVRRRFGPHRYAGRLVHYVDDIVQDCYVKLLACGGLDSFQPLPDRPLAIAFRAWLFGVVRNHCHNQLAKLGRDPIHKSDQPKPGDSQSDSNTGARGGVFESIDTVSPEVAFARDWLRAIADGAVTDVEARWRAQRKQGAERFPTLLPIALRLGGSYQSASEELGISYINARQLVDALRKDLHIAARKRVEDELRLEPGLSRESIDASVNAAIKEHFDAAFPGGHGSPPDLFCLFHREAKSQAADGAEPTEAQPRAQEADTPPESKP